MCQICKDGVELPTMMSTSRSLRDILLGCKHCLRARPGPHRNRVTSPCHKFCKICRLKILTSTWNQEDLKTQLSTPELKSNLSDHPSTALLEELTKPSVSSTSSTEQREDQDMTEGEQAVENQEVLKFELFPKLPVQLRIKIWHLYRKDQSHSRLIEVYKSGYSHSVYQIEVRSRATLLQINRETRYAFLLQYVAPFSPRNTKAPVGNSVAHLLIDPTRDTLLFTGDWEDISHFSTTFTNVFGENSQKISNHLKTCAVTPDIYARLFCDERFDFHLRMNANSLKHFMPNIEHLIVTSTKDRIIRFVGGKILKFPLLPSPRNRRIPHLFDGTKFAILDVELGFRAENMIWGDITFGDDTGAWAQEDVPHHFLSALEKEDTYLAKFLEQENENEEDRRRELEEKSVCLRALLVKAEERRVRELAEKEKEKEKERKPGQELVEGNLWEDPEDAPRFSDLPQWKPYR